MINKATVNSQPSIYAFPPRYIERVRMFLQSLDSGRGENEFYGKLSAADQRLLFGKYYGKGKIYINWLTGEVSHTIKVCFGQDFQQTEIDNFFGKIWS